MPIEILRTLLGATLAMSAAILIIGALRRPARALLGASLACWLWILVPVMSLAVVLPAPSQLLAPVQITFSGQMRSAMALALKDTPHSALSAFSIALLGVWSLGAASMLFATFIRQRRFRRSLGVLERGPDGLCRAPNSTAPMLLDVWNPKIVVPGDFDARYSKEERELVIAHERAHESRRDLAINLAASLVLCLFWFNPLMYRAITWLRMDQELACDALVMSRRGDARRLYAEALLKVQLAGESTWREPIGCHWKSVHPLKERIRMLTRPVPGRLNKLFGLAGILSLTTLASVGAWAGRSMAADGRPILVDLRVTVSKMETHEVKSLVTQYLVNSGEKIKDLKGRPMDFTCTPYLADTAGHSTDWSDQNARGIPHPQPGQILLDCAILEKDAVLRRPAVLVMDGGSGTIEVSDRGGDVIYKLEIAASSSAEKIAAAKKQAANR